MSANFGEGGKNGPVVEMLFPVSFFAALGFLLLPVFRSGEKIFKLIEIAPVKYAESLRIRARHLVKQIVV